MATTHNGVGDVEKGRVEATGPPSALNGPGPNIVGVDTSSPAYHFAPRPTRIGNPGALGLFAFASTTLILSLYNVQTRGIHTPNVVVGMAIFCGGLAQLLAGMWEFPRGNVFGGTAFTMYGSFWMSYATILIPSSGIIAAYQAPGAEGELGNALGIFLITWMIVTFLLLVTALRKNTGFIALFGFLTLTFALLAAGEFTASIRCQKAGGVLGAITAFIAYYVGLSELLNAEPQPVFNLPLGVIRNRRVD